MILALVLKELTFEGREGNKRASEYEPEQVNKRGMPKMGWVMGTLPEQDCLEQMIYACYRIVYNRWRHRLEQGHGYPICQGKDLEFYPKSKVLPLTKVCQDCIG